MTASGFQLREGEFRLRAGGFCLRASGIRVAEDGNGMRASGDQMREGVAGLPAGLFQERALSQMRPGTLGPQGTSAKALNACGRM